MRPPLFATLLPTVLATSLLLAGCDKAPPPEAAPRPVKLITVGMAGADSQLTLAGEVKARHEAAQGFRVPGQILRRLVDAGAAVQKGQALAVLDPRDYELAVQAATANLTTAKARLENAAVELKRVESLADKGFISRTELDRREVELTAARSVVEQAESALALEKNRLADTTLRAEAAGIVLDVHADAGETVAAGQPVVTLAGDGTREIEVAFPERHPPLALLRKGEATLWAAGNQAKIPVTLREWQNTADPVTRTYRARYTAAGQQDLLQLGRSVTLTLHLPSAMGEGIVLPATAIFARQGQPHVYRYDAGKGTVQGVPVTVTGLPGNDLKVAGLKSGDVVVATGTLTLTDGQKVTPFESRTESH